MNEILRDAQTNIENNDNKLTGYGGLMSKIEKLRKEIDK
jgi:hypothetical protein